VTRATARGEALGTATRRLSGQDGSEAVAGLDKSAGFGVPTAPEAAWTAQVPDWLDSWWPIWIRSDRRRVAHIVIGAGAAEHAIAEVSARSSYAQRASTAVAYAARALCWLAFGDLHVSRPTEVSG
jgi:hypothetical protein